jgi:hypothetical protein
VFGCGRAVRESGVVGCWWLRNPVGSGQWAVRQYVRREDAWPTWVWRAEVTPASRRCVVRASRPVRGLQRIWVSERMHLKRQHADRRSRQDAENSTQDACAPQASRHRLIKGHWGALTANTALLPSIFPKSLTTNTPPIGVQPRSSPVVPTGPAPERSTFCSLRDVSTASDGCTQARQQVLGQFFHIPLRCQCLGLATGGKAHLACFQQGSVQEPNPRTRIDHSICGTGFQQSIHTPGHRMDFSEIGIP